MYINKEKTLEVIDNPDIDIIALISDRGGRKSSVMQDILIQDALRGHPFVLIRSKSDINISDSWLSEYIRNKYEDYHFTTRKLNRNIQAIYMIDSSGHEYCFCYCMFLSLAEKYKSNYYEGFEKVRVILWEECIPNTPMIQSVRYVRQYMMNDLIALMSIYSTVCRKHKAKIVMLGNDISANLLNPVTVGFNLLERLTVNESVIDKVEIDDRLYTFYFLYFSFPGSVEHWLFNKELDINATIKIDDTIKQLDFILLTEFKRYHVYRLKNFIYISEQEQNNKVEFIQTEKDFFRKYNALHLYERFSLDLALSLLNDCYGVESYDIAQYFGAIWYVYPQFKKPEYKSKNSIINLSELCDMKYNDILNLPIYNNILHLKEIIKNNNIIYSNAQVKLLLQSLINTLDLIV